MFDGFSFEDGRVGANKRRLRNIGSDKNRQRGSREMSYFGNQATKGELFDLE